MVCHSNTSKGATFTTEIMAKLNVFLLAFSEFPTIIFLAELMNQLIILYWHSNVAVPPPEQCRGRRPYQEDRVVALQSFQVRATEDAGPSGCDSAVQRSYFGIFDGHSGEEVAALAAGRMHSILAQSLGSKS
eukprot:evm.model.scf_2188.1 EVM.evm.TU.scf_2188.1   scf_2188:1861-2253(-)